MKHLYPEHENQRQMIYFSDDEYLTMLYNSQKVHKQLVFFHQAF